MGSAIDEIRLAIGMGMFAVTVLLPNCGWWKTLRHVHIVQCDKARFARLLASLGAVNPARCARMALAFSSNDLNEADRHTCSLRKAIDRLTLQRYARLS